MTVKKLIEQLSKFPSDMTVWMPTEIFGVDSDSTEICSVQKSYLTIDGTDYDTDTNNPHIYIPDKDDPDNDEEDNDDPDKYEPRRMAVVHVLPHATLW